ncbi:YlbL family protein [Selenihalanaerobacter shriftii]|uniref:endopeptidase La n=1 Tax=Selenihalanaerobacter shriftii TaxID=142842 RepID=A0A1T4PI15_9FIRM|nr:PDZ domain-containing protein [Selenihalanaerobacter shriftii]SJZ91175.1 PDZ domain-containing protein [Selenihalanaerobacter shriftii]
MASFKNEKLNRLLIISLVVILVSLLSAIWPTDYYVESPGIAKELSSLVKVKNGYKDEIKGKFRLTAVSLETASVLEYYYVSLFKPQGVALTPLGKQLPPEVEPREYFEMMKDVMKESKLKAKAVALRQAGYDFEITGQGAEIVKVLKESNAKDKLKEGDIITEVDDKKISLVTEVIDKIRKRKIGESVDLTIKREDKTHKYSIKTKELENSPGKASLGVLISSYKRSYNFPVEIEINSGDIGGPSAGMVFTLEVLNQLTKNDLTHGKDIAGTGTIDLEGNVGEISGVEQKILAAEREGAEIFLSPAGNYEKAKESATKIKVVSVDKVEDAIDFLNSLE